MIDNCRDDRCIVSDSVAPARDGNSRTGFNLAPEVEPQEFGLNRCRNIVNLGAMQLLP
jgi:hypothetical protein